MDNIKILVTGATGFIGSRFIELYSSYYNEIVALYNSTNEHNISYENVTLKQCNITNMQKIKLLSKGCDVIVHIAFDHRSINNNKKGIKNILEICKMNRVKSLVYISSFSVYSAETESELQESSLFSKSFDPYVRLKISMERFIRKKAYPKLKAVILQPTIVLGRGGSWSKTIFNSCRYEKVLLPQNGEGNCNFVFVDDVCQAIQKSIFSTLDSSLKEEMIETFLISGPEIRSWKDVYSAHNDLMNLGKEQGMFSTLEISSCRKEYHESWPLNLILSSVYKIKIMSWIFTLVKELILIRRDLSEKNIANEDSFPVTKIGESISPIGITRKVYDCNYKVSLNKSKRKLNYIPKYFLKDGMNSIKQSLILSSAGKDR